MLSSDDERRCVLHSKNWSNPVVSSISFTSSLTLSSLNWLLSFRDLYIINTKEIPSSSILAMREVEVQAPEEEKQPTPAADKPAEQAQTDTAQPGDTVITLEVPRLARSTQQLCEIIDIVRDKRLQLVIIGSITLDCRDGQADPMSEAFLQMAGVFSQLELAMIRARVRSGMENARAKGASIGRPHITAEDIPAVFMRHYAAYKRGELNVSELARVCGICRGTVYKYLRLVEK